MDSSSILNVAAGACDDKRAEDIIALNMQGISLVADYFLICHGNSDKQVQAIAREVKHLAEESGIEVKKMEGFDEARWVLIDLGDVIAHVFHKEERGYYNLEKLWADAPRETLSLGINS